MAKFTDQYVVEFLADISKADSRVERLEKLINFLGGKKHVVELSLGGAKALEKLIDKLEQDTKLTATQLLAVRDAVKQTLSALKTNDIGTQFGNFTKLSNDATISANAIKALKDRLLDFAKTKGVGETQVSSSLKVLNDLLKEADSRLESLKRKNVEGKITPSKDVRNVLNIVELFPKLKQQIDELDADINHRIIRNAQIAYEVLNKLNKANLKPSFSNDRSEAFKSQLEKINSLIKEQENRLASLSKEKIISPQQAANLDAEANKLQTLISKRDALIARSKELERSGRITSPEKLDQGKAVDLSTAVAQMGAARNAASNYRTELSRAAKANVDLSTTLQVILGRTLQLNENINSYKENINNAKLALAKLNAEVARQPDGKATIAQATQQANLNNQIDVGNKFLARTLELRSANIAKGERLVEVYRNLLVALESGNKTESQAVKIHQKLFGDLPTPGNAVLETIQKIRGQLGNLNNTKLSGVKDQLSDIEKKGIATFNRMNSDIKDFSFFMNIAIEKIIRYRVAFIAMQKAVEGLKSTFTISKDIESQFVNLSKVIDNGTSNLSELKSIAFDFSRTFGRSVKEIVDIMFIWAQQGKTQQEIIQLTNSTLIGMAGANLSATDAVETLTSAIRVYNLSGQDSVIIFDKLIAVQRAFAVETQDLAESIKLLGATAEEFGLNIDSLLGSVTAIVEVTRKTGSQVANALKTIFAKFIDDDAVKVLRQLNIAVFDTKGNIRDLDDVLDEVAARWDTFTEAERLNIAKTVGGIRHYTQFVVLMEQYNTKLKAVLISEQARGLAAEQANKELTTTANQLQRINAVLTLFAEKTGNSFLGFNTTFKVFANILEAIFNNKNANSASKFGTVIANITGAILTFGTALLTVKAGFVAFELGVSRSLDLIKTKVIKQGQIIASANNSISNDILGKEKGFDIRAFSANLRLGQKDQQALTQAVLVSARTAKAVSVELVDGTRAVVAANGIVTRSEIQKAQAMLVSSKSAMVNASSMKSLGIAALTTGTLLKGLMAVFSPLNLAVTALTIGIPILVNKIIDSRRKIQDTSETLRNLNISLLDSSDSSKKLLKSTAILAAEFNFFNESLKGNTDLKDRQKALGGLLKTFDKIRGLNTTLSTVNKDAIAGIGVSSDDALKARSKVLEEINSILKTQLKIALDLDNASKDSANRRLISLNNELESLSKLAKSADTYQQILDNISTLKINDLNTVFNATGGTIFRFMPNDIGKEFGNLENTIKSLGDTSVNDFVSMEGALLDVGNIATEINNEFKTLKKEAPLIAEELSKNLPGGSKFSIDKVKLLRQINFAMADAARNSIPLTLDFLIGNSEEFKKATKFASVLRTNIGDINKELEELNNRLLESIESSTKFFGFTIDELEKMRKKVSQTSAEISVSFSHLKEDVRSFVATTALSGKPTLFLDEIAKRSQDILEKIISGRRELERQREAIQIASGTRGSLKNEEELKAAQEILSLTSKLSDIETSISAKKDKLNSSTDQEALGIHNEINGLELQRVGIVQKLQKLHESLTPSLGFGDLTNMALRYIQTLNKISDPTEEQRLQHEFIQRLFKQENDEATTMLDQLSKELELYNQRNGAQEAGLVNAVNLYNIERNRAELLEKQFSSYQEQRGIVTRIVDDLAKKLEVGQEAVGDLIELQNSRLKARAQIETVLRTNASALVESSADLARIQNTILSGEEGRKQILDEIEVLYNRQNGTGTILRKILEDQFNSISEIQKIDEERLKIQAQYANIVKFGTDQVKTYSKHIENARDLQKEIAQITGDRQGVIDAELAKAKDINDIRMAGLDVIISSLNSLKQVDKTNSDIIDGAIQSVEAMKASQKSLIELMGEKLQAKLEKIKPVLSELASLAGEFAKALTNALVGVNETLLNRYSAIADQQLVIKEKELDISELKKEQSRILDQNSSEYKNISESIKEAAFELNQMNKDMDKLSSKGKLFSDIFKNFSESISKVVIDIQAKQLEDSLTKLFTNNSLFSSLLSASEQAALNLANSIREEANALAEKAKQGLSEGSLELQLVLDKFIFDLKSSLGIRSTGKDAGLTQSVPSSDLKDVTGFSPTQVDSNNVILSALDRTNRTSQAGATQPIIGPIEESPESKRTRELAEERKLAAINALSSAVNLISSQLGTALAASIFGPSAAKGASIGSGLGLLAGEAGVNALGLAATSVGSVLLPGIGSILGGLIGGLFSRGEQKPKPRFNRQVDENTSSLNQATEAIRALTVEFQDLRSELINAPSRFVSPSLPGLGSRLNLSTSNGQSIPLGAGAGNVINLAFNVQGSLDQNAANSIINQIEQAFHVQSRTNSNSSRLFR